MDIYPKAGLYPEAMAAFRQLVEQSGDKWDTLSAKDKQAMWLMFLAGWIARESFGNA